MSYYIIFIKGEKYKAYTKDKNIADSFREQRRFYSYKIEKLKRRKTCKELRERLGRSRTELIKYRGLYVTPREKDILCMEANKIYEAAYDIFSRYNFMLECIKFKDDELKKLIAFGEVIDDIIEKMEQSFFEYDEDKFKDIFKMKKVYKDILDNIIREEIECADLVTF